MSFPLCSELACYLLCLVQLLDPFTIIICDLLIFLSTEVVKEVVHDLTDSVVLDRLVQVNNDGLELVYTIRHIDIRNLDVLRAEEYVTSHLLQETRSSVSGGHPRCRTPQVNLSEVYVPVT